MNSIELWGGVECSVVRIGSHYHDQLRRCGHDERLDDLDRFYELGLRTLRVPLLWERTAPRAPDDPNWAWSDARFYKLWQLGIRPVVGLMHHGSGPHYASVEQPHFPEAFARYAGAVAERYPWVADYVPINEPFATARHMGFDGHWYPHQRGERAFFHVLLNQLKATVLAMCAIRRVRPDARLVQTEAFGLLEGAGFPVDASEEPCLHWLPWELLRGRVDSGHPLFAFMTERGVSEKDLHFFTENPCPPEVLGLNYYLSPTGFRAGEALGPLLRRIWDRYGLPLAVTELHLGNDPAVHARQFEAVWEVARQQADEGIDLRAVTAWALLGSHGRDSQEFAQRYQPGLFDVRSVRPQPTALACLVNRLATGREEALPA